MGDRVRLAFALVSSSERTIVDPKLFCNLAIAKRCAWLARFDFFNRFLDRIHNGGVMMRFVEVMVWWGASKRDPRQKVTVHDTGTGTDTVRLRSHYYDIASQPP